MATCTHKVGTADTGASPNTTGSFVPSTGDLLVVFCVASGTTDASPTCTSTSGVTFSLMGQAQFNSSASSIYYWIADSLVTAGQAVSQTVTCDMPSDGSTGTVIFVVAVSGMTKTGATAMRNNNNRSNQTAGTTPSTTFLSAALSSNPVLGCVGNVSSPAGITPPTSWTEHATEGDLGYGSPTTGGAYAFRDSGNSGTTITWGGTSATAYGVVALELDASGNSTVIKDMLGNGFIPYAR